MAHSFELWLDSDMVKRQTCLTKISRIYGKTAIPFYENPSPGFELFYRLDLPGDKNIYDQAFDIVQIDGVIEVDPIKKILGLFNEPQKGSYNSDEDYPYKDFAWNHTITNFDQAVAKSVADGKLDLVTGTGIRVAQLDTGVTLHPELSNIKNFGIDFEDHDNDPTDPLVNLPLNNPGHGTATSSIFIGSKVDRKDDRVDGLFPYVNFVPYRIANSVIHFISSHIGEAITKAVDDGCSIITMSMGGAPPRASWREAVRYATEKGVIMCFAAGNNVKFVIWPARYPEAIAVAGVNLNGEPWEGSCYGEDVDISGPGENVYVARVNEGDQQKNVYTYTFGSGTSYAVPHIAAAAALYLNHYKTELETLSPQQKVEAFRFALSTSAHQPKGWDSKNFGTGILDALAMLSIGPDKYLSSHVAKASLFARSYHRSAETPSIRQKEMWDLLLNNQCTSEAALDKHIQTEGSATAKKNYQKLKTTIRPLPKRAELFEIKATRGPKKFNQVVKEYADGVFFYI